MLRVFIVGAAGKVGRRVLTLLPRHGHVGIALHRNPGQAPDLKALQAETVAGDLTALDAAGLAELMTGADMILFSAGAGGAGIDLTNAVDGRGLELAVAAAKIAGIERFLLVSAFPDAARDRETSASFENYMRVKRLADAYLVASGLDWVILRPGMLTDQPGTGSVRADLAIPYGAIPRDDVAATLVEIIGTPAVTRRIIEVTSGPTPIASAIARLA